MGQKSYTSISGFTFLCIKKHMDMGEKFQKNARHVTPVHRLSLGMNRKVNFRTMKALNYG